MIFTGSSGWLSSCAALLKESYSKILATSGHRILPFPLLWMPGETLGHRCQRSVRTPYGPSSCKLVWAWSRTLHSAERGVPQVTSFSIQVPLHDDSACLRSQLSTQRRHNWWINNAKTSEQLQWALHGSVDITDQQPVCFSLFFTEMSTRFTGRWKLVPLATCQGFFRLANNSLIETVNLGSAP